MEPLNRFLVAETKHAYVSMEATQEMLRATQLQLSDLVARVEHLEMLLEERDDAIQDLTDRYHTSQDLLNRTIRKLDRKMCILRATQYNYDALRKVVGDKISRKRVLPDGWMQIHKDLEQFEPV